MKNIEFEQLLFNSVNKLINVREEKGIIYVTPPKFFDKRYMPLFYDSICYFYQNQFEAKGWVMTDEFLDDLIDYINELTTMNFEKSENEKITFLGLPVEFIED